MFTKYYEKIKKFIKENYWHLLFSIVLVAVCFYPLPYYIYHGGGTINVDQRIEIDNAYSSKGSFHLCYVSEIKATIPTYILAKILPNWELVKMEEVTLNENETDQDIFIRDRIYLNDANTNAIRVAYEKAHKSFEITKTQNYVIYLTETAKTDLKIGDDIQKVDNQPITSLENLKEIVSTKEVGQQIIFDIERDKKERKAYAEVMEINGTKQIGIALQNSYQYNTDPNIKLKFSSNESGPSGGLLLTLSIYNHLTSQDITRGKKIAGTGTIDAEGNVGSIGGVKYKLAGAVLNQADLFLVPAGENYEEAIALQKKNNYKIQIIGVSTFEEALEALSQI